MSLLLDTHVLLWWLADDPRLSDVARERLETEPRAAVSSASCWEVAIKVKLGKLPAPDGDVRRLPDLIAGQGFSMLPITAHHAIAAAALPDIHRDPFDRLLVAQAREEGLAIVTKDRAIQAYDVETLY